MLATVELGCSNPSIRNVPSSIKLRSDPERAWIAAELRDQTGVTFTALKGLGRACTGLTIRCLEQASILPLNQQGEEFSWNETALSTFLGAVFGVGLYSILDWYRRRTNPLYAATLHSSETVAQGQMHTLARAAIFGGAIGGSIHILPTLMEYFK